VGKARLLRYIQYKMEGDLSAKLLAVMGSPRKGGNTDVLVDEALAAFRELPHESSEKKGETEKIYLSSLQINPCRGCFSCKHGKGLDSVCVQRDDMTGLYQKIFEADALLWATPVYMWSPTAQMKLFLDRLFPLGDYQKTRWRCALQGKPVGLIIVYAESDPLDSGVVQTRDILEVVAKSSGGRVVFVMHSTVGEMGTTRENTELIGQVRESVSKLR
jgi:multimeric flavodoxin WrbA